MPSSFLQILTVINTMTSINVSVKVTNVSFVSQAQTFMDVTVRNAFADKLKYPEPKDLTTRAKHNFVAADL